MEPGTAEKIGNRNSSQRAGPRSNQGNSSTPRQRSSQCLCSWFSQLQRTGNCVLTPVLLVPEWGFVCLFVLLWIVCPSSAIECRGWERTIYKKLVFLILKSSDQEELYPDLVENTVSPRDRSNH